MTYQFLKVHPAIAGKDLTLFGSKRTCSPTRRTLRNRHMTGHQLADGHLLNHPTHNLSHFMSGILDQSVMGNPRLRETPLCLIEFDFQFSASPQRRFQFLPQIDNNAFHGLPPVTRTHNPNPQFARNLSQNSIFLELTSLTISAHSQTNSQKLACTLRIQWFGTWN